MEIGTRKPENVALVGLRYRLRRLPPRRGRRRGRVRYHVVPKRGESHSGCGAPGAAQRRGRGDRGRERPAARPEVGGRGDREPGDRKSTRLNSSHSQISYAVFCLKKKKTRNDLELWNRFNQISCTLTSTFYDS